MYNNEGRRSPFIVIFNTDSFLVEKSVFIAELIANLKIFNSCTLHLEIIFIMTILCSIVYR